MVQRTNSNTASWVCEWCGMRYPEGCYPYKKCYVHNDIHIICKDCFERIEAMKKGDVD